MEKISFEVNGKPVSVDVHPFSRLLDVLRNELELTGTKEGCGEGECGACSVFIDGILTNSCLVPIAQVQNCKVETIENIRFLLFGNSRTRIGDAQNDLVSKSIQFL